MMFKYFLYFVFYRQIYGYNILGTVPEFGYPLEQHKNIHTLDGYNLTLHRIPFGKTCPPSGIRYPILLIPGVMAASDQYTFMDPQSGLAYLLADRGYDVWIANLRGTSYSRPKYFSTKDSEALYWKFSLYEFGVYDLTAMIDYILGYTNFPKLQVISFSQGTLVFAIMCSEKPEYNEKVDIYVAIAPMIHLNLTHPWMKLITPYEKVMPYLFNGIHAVYGIELMQPFEGFFNCRSEFCLSVLKKLSGFSRIEADLDLWRLMVQSAHEGFGIKQIRHLAQLNNAGRFIKFDYGYLENIKHYGTPAPPEFNEKSIKVPTAIYYAKKDVFVTPENVEILKSELPNIVDSYLVEEETFSHLHFVIANTITENLYKRIFRLLQNYKSVTINDTIEHIVPFM